MHPQQNRHTRLSRDLDVDTKVGPQHFDVEKGSGWIELSEAERA